MLGYASVVVLMLLMWECCHVSAFGRGAGTGSCDNFQPGGPHAPNGQNFPSPYQITFQPATYTPNQAITVTIKGCDRTFKGFLIQARRADTSLNQDERIGYFTAQSGVTQQRCGTATAGGLTHTSSSPKSTLTFQWNAPAQAEGHVIFRATIMANSTQVYWMNIFSNTLRDASLGGSSSSGLQPPTAVVSPCPGITTSGNRFPRDSACGRTKGCFSDCTSQGCTFIVSWQQIQQEMEFGIKAYFPGTGDKYMSIGFSTDTSMGSDFVSDCVLSSGVMRATQSYNEGKSSSSAIGTQSVNLISGGFTDGLFECVFHQPIATSFDRQPDLNNNFNILFARGPAKPDFSKEKHSESPLFTTSQVDFQSMDDLAAEPARYPMVQAHGSLMVVAWIFAASIGVIIARYYKKMLPGKQIGGKDIWFQLHRLLMVLAALACIIAFIIIFVFVGGYSQVGDESAQKAHPIIGIITTVLVVINPIMAMFRPHPGTPNRPIFNWAHWGVGSVAHGLGVATVFLGTQMDKSNLPRYSLYILAAFAAWQVFVEIVLSIMKCTSEKPSKREAYELQAPGQSNPTPPAASEPSFLKMLVLVTHMIVVSGFTIAIIVLIVIN